MIPYATDVKTEDGITYVKTTTFDDAAIARNRALKAEDVFQKARLNLHDDADVRAIFSFPTVLQFNIFKRKYPDIWAMIDSKVESERIEGSRKLMLIHPGYCLMQRI